MQHYRCKCGKQQVVLNYSPEDCECCESCGSNIVAHPKTHKSSKPHDWTEYYVMEDGKKKMYIACRHCYKVKPPTIDKALQLTRTMWERLCDIQDKEGWILAVQRSSVNQQMLVRIKLSGHGATLRGQAFTLDEAIMQLLPIHREWKCKCVSDSK
ncbi:hypothetical protein LCGC14_0392520 [marine sediment metagenome]|uniref:Uncharacterized protein n=1 Tax=marine sediment metagenome TaxID=412755 RepID=A0A0F9W8E5_9ZZZZ